MMVADNDDVKIPIKIFPKLSVMTNLLSLTRGINKEHTKAMYQYEMIK